MERATPFNPLYRAKRNISRLRLPTLLIAHYSLFIFVGFSPTNYCLSLITKKGNPILQDCPDGRLNNSSAPCGRFRLSVSHRNLVLIISFFDVDRQRIYTNAAWICTKSMHSVIGLKRQKKNTEMERCTCRRGGKRKRREKIVYCIQNVKKAGKMMKYGWILYTIWHKNCFSIVHRVHFKRKSLNKTVRNGIL